MGILFNSMMVDALLYEKYIKNMLRLLIRTTSVGQNRDRTELMIGQNGFSQLDKNYWFIHQKFLFSWPLQE